MKNMFKKISMYIQSLEYNSIDPEFFVKPNSFQNASIRFSKSFNVGAENGLIAISKTINPSMIPIETSKLGV